MLMYINRILQLICIIIILDDVLAVSDIQSNKNFQATNSNVTIEEFGIRINVNDIELFFNSSKGGEITEYYDLSNDPNKTKNIVNLDIAQYEDIFPLFTTFIWYNGSIALWSTAGSIARIELVNNTNDLIIIDVSSSLRNKKGIAYKPPIKVYSRWIINKSTGLIQVDRAIDSMITLYDEGKFYPFYVTRILGYQNKYGTFYLFNSTYSYAHQISHAEYKVNWSSYPIFPKGDVFGIASPFSNKTLGGDGTHNMIIVYKLNKEVNKEIRSDNYHDPAGAKIEQFGITYWNLKRYREYLPQLRYSIFIYLTHDPINETNVQKYALLHENTSVIHQ